MDKEAQEKIAQIIWFTDQSCQSEHPTQRHLDCAKEALKRLEILGYRKLPEGKPPVLSDKKIAMAKNPILVEDWVDFIQYVRGVTEDDREVAKAQWDICVKHYEGVK